MEKRMEKQQSFGVAALERLQSFRLGALDKQKSFKMEKQQSFRNAAVEKQQSFVQRRSKESPGKKGDTPLHLAARAGNLVHVEKILMDSDDDQVKDLIAKQNQDGETALYVAAEKGYVDVVSEILKVSNEQSAAIKAHNSFDAFHIAVRQGHVAVLEVLLSHFPALAMTANSSNSTALDTAATKGHIDVVNLLLETGAGLAKIARRNGKTALHMAARLGHDEVVKALLSKDPSISLRTDSKGQTALHMAVKANNIEIATELLVAGPSVINLGDNKGNTPLHIAVQKGRPKVLQTLLSVEGIDINAVNKAGDTPLGTAEKTCKDEIAGILREAGALAAKEGMKPPNAALKQTVSDIKHDVESQLVQTRQTQKRVQSIKKRLRKLHIGGLNNAINSNTVVAVLIATVAFAAIFTVPGQYVETPTDGFTPGQAYIARNAAFIIFLVFDSLALFISLAVVVVQTSLIVTEQKAKKQMIFVMNKLMWLACLFISVSFISLTYVVVGHHDWWLACATTVIGSLIMLVTMGSMCYCIIMHRIEEKTLRNIKRTSTSRSHSWAVSAASDSELLNSEYKKIYAL